MSDRVMAIASHRRFRPYGPSPSVLALRASIGLSQE